MHRMPAIDPVLTLSTPTALNVGEGLRRKPSPPIRSSSAAIRSAGQENLGAPNNKPPTPDAGTSPP